jgi:hypothetical protein
LRSTKYLGLALGLVLTLATTIPVLAGQIGPNAVGAFSPGWNTQTAAVHTAGTMTFNEKLCSINAGPEPLFWVAMHHWPFTPQTGIGGRTLVCQDTGTYVTGSWSVQSGVDYSIEYWSGGYNVNRMTYKILFPGS